MSPWTNPPDLAVVHLVRESNNVEVFRQFLRAYAAHDAGAPHVLVLAYKGFDRVGIRSMHREWSAILDLRARHLRGLVLPDRGYDLGTYRRACLRIDSRYVCFLNSFSRPLEHGWLRRIATVARRSDVGIAGATGSLQNVPHIRTNAFCMRRDLYLRLVRQDPLSKKAANALESSANGITQRIREAGLHARIVSRSGDVDILDGRSARTFWTDGQEELLVADNRTDDYTLGSRLLRRELIASAWKRRESTI